jgi:hypothetical protein
MECRWAGVSGEVAIFHLPRGDEGRRLMTLESIPPPSFSHVAYQPNLPIEHQLPILIKN